MVRRRVVEPVRPAEAASRAGLAYTLWLPPAEPLGGLVILHGAGSCKESHHDFCRAALGAGFAALAFDARGHGQSQGSLDGRALDDVAQMCDVLREHLAPGRPLALRGSSMGGYLAIIAAERCRADAVVAICPASAEGLQRGLRARRLNFSAEPESLAALLAGNDLRSRAAELNVPILLLHAEGDEVVPVASSRALARAFSRPESRLIVVPGGHHRSVQHDGELQAFSLRWLARLTAG